MHAALKALAGTERTETEMRVIHAFAVAIGLIFMENDT